MNGVTTAMIWDVIRLPFEDFHFGVNEELKVMARPAGFAKSRAESKVDQDNDESKRIFADFRPSDCWSQSS